MNHRSVALGLSLILVVPIAVAQRQADIPAGTQIQVRMIDNLSSEKAQAGDRFRGTLQRGIVVNGRTLYPRGCEVSGQVTNVHRSGRLSDPGELELTLVSIRNGRNWFAISAQPFLIKGESHAKNNVSKIGGGAALGAIIGGVAGGGKGAAIGAGVGAGVGTTAAAASGKKEARVESEAVLVWVAAPLSAAQRDARDDRYREDDRNRESDRRDREYDRDRDYRVFSLYDRRMIRGCFVENRSNLPPGLAKKDRLPPGLEKQLRRDGTLPPGLQKRVQPLPDACVEGLPRLPYGWARVVLSRRVLLLDAELRIWDMFDIDED